MAKKKKPTSALFEKRPPRAKISPAESLKRMQNIEKRREAMIAAVRKNKDRGVSA